MEPPATTAVLNHSNSYADSANSSPRSRTTDTWEDHQAPPPARLRLMCSYGGHIVPRPHDKSLCYVGGETRIVVADRSSSLGDLRARLSKTLLGGGGFALKYQLPSEDLDSLISVTTDEDLDNMLDEYDRSRPNRLRLFLFSSSSSSASSSAAAADDDWFVTALNAGGSSPAAPPTASVNCLLGLDDDDDAAPISGSGSASAPEILPPPPQQRRIQEVQTVPDSPMLETTSSFGSTSSSPSLVNLPPIRLHVDSAADHFSQITVSSSAAAGGGGGGIGAGFIALSSPPADFDDDRSDHGGALPIGYRKQQQQQKSTAVLDLPSPDSVSSDSSFGRAKPQFHDPNLQIPINNNNNIKTSNNMSDPNSVYVLQQQQQPQQPEFLQHHHHPPAAYYQPVYTSQQFPVYYIPARPSTQQQQQQQQHQQQTHYVNQSDASPLQVQRINPAPPPQQQHYIGYSPVHHQPVSAAAAASYVYDYAADPARHHRHHQAQVYYAAPPPQSMASQYHTVPAPDPDTLKQMRTSQPL